MRTLTLLFACLVPVTVISAPFPDRMPVPLKTIESLIPTNLRPFAGLFLENVNLKSIFKSVAVYVIPTACYNPRISQQCRDDSWLYVESLTNLTEWAMKMYDTSGKIPDGISSGNYHSMGHFDQCLKVRCERENDRVTQFTGKYCPVFLLPKVVPERLLSGSQLESKFDSMTLTKIVSKVDIKSLSGFDAKNVATVFPNLAFCLPSTCSASDIETGVRDLVTKIGDEPLDGIQIVPYATEAYCTAADTEQRFDVATLTAIWIFGLLTLFLVLGTAYDIFLRRSGEYSNAELETCQRILLSFSILSNGSQVLDTRNSTEGSLACLNGIRFFSMAWVVLGHTWTMCIEDTNANMPGAKEDGRYWAYQGISNYTVPVDTFFFLSGLLVAYVTLRELDKQRGKLNIPLMYLHRFLRLTPVYAFILLFIATLLFHLGSGPFWGKIVLMSEKCRIVWWRHLLYVNNFFRNNAAQHDCMVETWYLAVDMQVFLISPFFIYTLWRWHKFGISLVVTTIVACTAITMRIVVTNNMPPTYINFATDNPFRLLTFFNQYYVIPWCRIMPYLVGILMGYVFHKLRNQVIAVNAWIIFAGWLASTSTALAVVYGLAGYYVESEVPVFPAAVSVLYASLHRTAWAIALSWLVFACVNGYGGQAFF